MIIWEMIHPDMRPDMLGLLPYFLDEDNPEPAARQFNHNYQHGGGWDPFVGFKLYDDNSIEYPGDPPLEPLAQTRLRDELIVFYDHSWVAVIQPDRSFEICRMD